MDYIFIAMDIPTLVLTACMCVTAIKKWKKGQRSVFYFIFLFFYVVPILLDYLFAFPTYSYSHNMYGFEVSYKDSSTRVVYDLLVLGIQWLLLRLEYKKSPSLVVKNNDNYYKYISTFLYLGLVIAPILVLLLGNDKSILYTFMWRENELSETGYLPIAERLSYVGICCAVVLFFWKSGKNKFIRRIISIIFAYINICIQGKRSILFFLLLVVPIVMLPNIRIRNLTDKQRRRIIRVLFFLIVAVLTIIVAFTIKIKVDNRGYEDMKAVYTSLRIDIFRDDRVRMAIYAFLYPSKMTILTYPGQTIIPALITFFPLDYIFGFMRIHPIAYSAYISAALTGSSVVSQADAFMSPSILAELFSNFHIFGVAIFIWMTLWFAKMVDRYPYPANVFIYISYIMLHIYSVSYIAYFLEFSLILCLLCRNRFTEKQNPNVTELLNESNKI